MPLTAHALGDGVVVVDAETPTVSEGVREGDGVRVVDAVWDGVRVIDADCNGVRD